LPIFRNASYRLLDVTDIAPTSASYNNLIVCEKFYIDFKGNKNLRQLIAACLS